MSTADAVTRLNEALEGRYRIERELGEGGMATVYLAEDLRHERHVAIKVLRPELATALGPDRFLQEIRIAAKLQHPHILPLHDSGAADDFLFYVMPHIEGETLRDRLQREGGLPIADTLRILRNVVDALSEAHRHGVVHRDIKPANVLLRGRHALVADFGVAKAVSEATGRHELTTVGVSLGTPAYMAPEQAAADPQLDHRVDIYAVGVIAYELLAGRTPFSAATPHQLLAAQVTEAPRPVSEHRAAVPAALEATVMRCLEKNPADRWQTAEELLGQLESVMTPSGGVTPTGTQPVTAPRGRSWRFPVAVAAAVAAVVSVGVYILDNGRSSETGRTLAEVRQLTANPLERALTGAAISPDGAYLAYAEPTGLFVQNIGTGEVTRRSLPESMIAWDVGWLPDGTRLFLLASRVRGALDLYTMPLLGGSPSLVMESVLRAAPSPTGESFGVIRAGTEGGGRFGSLWTVGLQGQEPRVIARAGQDAAFWSLSWSPDSQRIAVGVSVSDTLAIRSVDTVTGSTTTLVEDPRLFQAWTGILPFVWCGDGRLFYSLIDGSFSQATSNVWVIDTDVGNGAPRGEPRRLTQRFGSNVRGLTATADCSTLAAMLVRNQADVWVAELEGGGTSLSDEMRVTSDERADYPVTWIGTDRLIVRSPRAGTVDLYQWHLGSTDVTTFIRAEQDLQQGGWDSSTERFVYSRDGIWVTGREGGIGSRITEGPAMELSCAYGGGCVGGRRIGSDFVFYRVDIEAGTLEEVLRIDHRPPFTNFALSPDGQTAAVVHNDNNVIRLISLVSGDERSLEIAEWSLFEFVAWSADGRRLFVNAGFATSGVYPVLLSVDLNGDHSVLREAPNVWHVRPHATPDGRYLAFAAMPFQGNAYLLTDF